jgi:hypothetical protein
LSLRALPAELRVEPFAWLAPLRLVPDLDPLDLLDLEPPDLVAIEFLLLAIEPRLPWRGDYLMPASRVG